LFKSSVPHTPLSIFFFTSPSLSAICIAYIHTINVLGQEARACNLGYRPVRSIAVILLALRSRPGQITRCALSPPRRVSYTLPQDPQPIPARLTILLII
jgi:hypothetical protein